LKIPKANYSCIAKYYDKVRPPPADAWISKIIEYGKINDDSKVLDIGCGTGRYPLRILTFKNAQICGLDVSADMLKSALAKDERKRVLWVLGDAQKLPFQANQFDCVYMTLVLHHIENRTALFQRVYYVLKTGGSFVVMTPSHSQIKRHVIRHFPGVTAIDLRRFPTIPSIKKTMIENGFRNVHSHVIRYDEGYISTNELLEKVRSKYISTLTLLSEERFKKGLKIFHERMRKYGDKIRRISEFNFVVGQK
jgi:ubiquinone/menaquinone biosynthesis C-methylase UbiE